MLSANVISKVSHAKIKWIMLDFDLIFDYIPKKHLVYTTLDLIIVKFCERKMFSILNVIVRILPSVWDWDRINWKRWASKDFFLVLFEN
jgi:hypothetical protein